MSKAESPIEHAIAAANDDGRLAVAAFVTGGFPSLSAFPDLIRSIAPEVDLIEIGVPFSDPMADGITIQRASEAAIRNGATLRWIFDTVRQLDVGPPILLMSYLNPLLASGLDRLADTASRCGVDGFIIPDLPCEESNDLRSILDRGSIDLIQLVSPVTPVERLRVIAAAARGFIYAVTVTGTTGGSADRSEGLADYLGAVRAATSLPVLAGFGIRHPSHVRRIQGHAHGVIVGSALIDRIHEGEDPIPFLRELRQAATTEREVVT